MANKFKETIIYCENMSFEYLYIFTKELEEAGLHYIRGKIEYIIKNSHSSRPFYIWINIPTVYNNGIPNNNFQFADNENPISCTNKYKLDEVFKFYNLKPWVNWPLLKEN